MLNSGNILPSIPLLYAVDTKETYEMLSTIFSLMNNIERT